MRERRREVFVLRSIGAPSSFVLALLLLESLLIVTIGIAAAVVALFGAIAAVNGFLADQIGVTLSMVCIGNLQKRIESFMKIIQDLRCLQDRLIV